MEPRAHHILVGLFTLVVALAAIFSALWLSKSDSQNETREYVIVFNEAVRGLSHGSAVQYSGITVGSVSELSLDPEDPRKVIAHIRIRSSVPIREDTQARLALAGISGASVIQLTGGSPDSPPLLATEDGLPVITARRSSISLLLTNSDDLMAGVSRLVISAQRLLTPENTRLFGETLRHIESLTRVLSEHESDWKESIKNIAQITEQTGLLLQQTSSLAGKLEVVVDGPLTRSLTNAEQAFVSLQASAAHLDRLLDDNAGALSSGAQGLHNLGPALQELRESMAAIKAVARRLEDNPTNYLLGRETIQEYTP